MSVEKTFRYSGKGNSLSRNSRIYLKLVDSNTMLQSKRIFYRYSNLHTSSTGNFLKYLNIHKRIIDERIVQGVQAVMHKFITTVLLNMVKKLPMESQTVYGTKETVYQQNLSFNVFYLPMDNQIKHAICDKKLTCRKYLQIIRTQLEDFTNALSLEGVEAVGITLMEFLHLQHNRSQYRAA
ncbi:hypothetical protein QE152_g1229 [Popillia japonica]|uniref:Uncharacterized protein n=1 Tax=Popillia japonica TaxID=7064 RepID=A0AAW1NBD2_POPJA